MSPQNRPLIVGLAAPGLLWLATSVAFGQTPPLALPGLPNPAPTSSIAKTYQALLLSNGKVVRGEIVEDTTTGLYRLRQNGGPITYPKQMVLKAANSLEELYQFQAIRLPEGDPDERMKLARWCLTEHLTAQAKEQLDTIQAMCPNDAEVKRMLYNLASTAERPPVDAGLRRTSGEMNRGDAPATLDPRVLVKAQRRFNSLPEIFDLPQAQAVKRYNEFAEFVQPILQQSCARCHNEKYQGDFQLVEVKTRRDQSNSDIARANLDATTRLINPDDPARSELLSAGLVPHGGSKNAVFRGPNDRSYQVLSIWAKSLKPGRSTVGGTVGSRTIVDSVTRAVDGSTDNSPGDAFAADRSGRGTGSGSSMSELPSRAGLPTLPGLDFTNRAAAGMMTPPPKTIVEQFDESADFVNAPGDKPEFLPPYSVGGVPAARPDPSRFKAGTSPKRATSGPKDVSMTPSITAKTATQVGPGTVVVGSTEDPNELPGMNQPHYPPKADADSDPAKKKPKVIDNALLEKMMKSRNGGNP